MRLNHFRRREFITLLGSAAAARPLAARAQQPAMPVVGYLYGGSPESSVQRVAAFRKGLSETGFKEGENVAIEFRWANDRTDRLPELATDLVRRKVAVIATPGSTPAALAAKAASASIPIGFAIGGGPVALGLVASLTRPGGNVTGISFESTEMVAKALSLLHELVPQAARIVAVVNPDSGVTEAAVKNLETAAATLGLQVEVFHASTDSEI